MALLSTIVSKPLTNNAYGFPKGAQRRIKPKVLACIHITGNANNLGPTAATNERNYANRKGSGGPSAHYYLNRDGTGVRAIDPIKFAAWSNGDILKPDLSKAGAKYLVELKPAHNPNEGVALEIENVGTASTKWQITAEQMDTMARLLARYAKVFNLPINRNTVITHSYLNSVNRPNCAWLAAYREKALDKLVALGNHYLNPPKPLPKSVSMTWTATPPVHKVTTITWTPSGYKITYA